MKIAQAAPASTGATPAPAVAPPSQPIPTTAKDCSDQGKRESLRGEELRKFLAECKRPSD